MTPGTGQTREIEIEIAPLDGGEPISLRRAWHPEGVVTTVGTSRVIELSLPRERYPTIGQKVCEIAWASDGIRLEAITGPAAPVLLDGERIGTHALSEGEHELVLGAGHRFRLTVRIVGGAPELPASVASRRHPYNDAYPTCERTDAKLVIYPARLDPRAISDRLGISPTRFSVEGKPDDTGQPAPRSLWVLSSENRVASKDLRRHLDWLIERLMPAKDALRALQAAGGNRMSIACIWWSAHGQGGPTLWPEQMAAMAELGLECTFDISFYGEDDE